MEGESTRPGAVLWDCGDALGPAGEGPRGHCTSILPLLAPLPLDDRPIHPLFESGALPTPTICCSFVTIKVHPWSICEFLIHLSPATAQVLWTLLAAPCTASTNPPPSLSLGFSLL